MISMSANLVPVNGSPANLAEYVDHEVRAYRAQGTPEAAFLADQLERVAQLIRWTRATTPAEYADRLDVWEQSIREQEYQRGYEAGRESANRFPQYA